jgi:hypothetical protein
MQDHKPQAGFPTTAPRRPQAPVLAPCKPRLALAAALCALLAACAVSPEALRAPLDAAKPCCEGFATLPPPVALTQDSRLRITGQSPLFVFPEGRSRFAVFAVPEGAAGRTLVVRSFGNGPTTKNGWGAHLFFFPMVTFLNPAREVIGTATDPAPVAGLYKWYGEGNIMHRLRIPPSAAFAVFHTPPNSLGSLYETYVDDGPGFTVMVGGNIISNPAGRSQVRAVRDATGELMVVVE